MCCGPVKGSLTILSLCASSVLAAAQTPPSNSAPSEPVTIDPQKAALIREIFKAKGSQEIARQIVETTVSSRARLIRENPRYPSGFADELVNKVRERMEAQDFTDFMMPDLANKLSIEELRQVLAFWTSPVGEKWKDSEVAALAGAQRRIRTWAVRVGREVEQEIAQEHPEWKLSSPPAILSGTPDATGVYRIGNGVSAPQLITKVEPQYTRDASKAHLSGTVVLWLTIDEKGVPGNIQVLKPLGKGLDEKAIEAVTQWRFKPGMKDGAPVKTQAQVEVNFRLLDNPPPTP